MMSENEQIRYQRQLILPRFGEEAQQKLKKARVFVAGAGGLGGPVCYYLAAAGIGHLVVCDRDKVELSNLNRQILHGTKDIGEAKADSAYRTLSNLNPDITIKTHNITIDDITIAELANGADIMVDCLDNIATRHVLNWYSVRTGTPLVHAGIDGWHAQLALLIPQKTPCIKCLFGEAKDTTEPKPVLGVVPGIVGTMQALLTIKHLIGDHSGGNGLMYFDAGSLQWTRISIERNKACTVCGSNN